MYSNLLIKVANNSDMNSRHSAILVNKSGKIYSKAFNDKYGHAEVNCLKILKNNIISNSQFYLICIRINNSNKLVYSKPCFHCIEYMQKYNVSYIYYSDHDGNLIKENIKDIHNHHISIGNKFNTKTLKV
jgi:pyrimidine deaminase RibD-like protein